MSIYSEIKKYLLFLVGFFCLLLVGHIIVLYFYSDAIEYPLPGGTVNVGILWEKPKLNVLNFDTKIENDPNDTVLRFIYRWLVRFSPTDKKMVGDLASCDIENFPAVRCRLSQNALWNDGTAMTKEDVIKTYAFFREKALNEHTKSQISLIDVSENEGDIVFKFKTRDITALQALFLPIIREKDIVEWWNGDINDTLSFSGPYVFTNKEDQKKSIFLARNPYYTHTNRPFFFDQVRFGFGTKNSEIYKVITPDIILSDANTDGKNTQWNNYIRPAFQGAFINAARVPLSLRKSLYQDIFGTIDTKDASLMPEENVFLWDIPNSPRTTNQSTFFQAVSALGYSYGGTFQAPENKPTTTPKKPLSYITNPGNVSPLFVANPTIDIRWTAPAGTTKVIINDYTLRNFVAKKRTFVYTAKKEFTNLTTGPNIYRVSFYGGTKLLAEESVTIYHDTDQAGLEKMKTSWEKENTTAPAAPVVVPTNLDPKKLYNREGRALSLKIIVQSESPYLRRIADEAKKKIEELGAEAVIEELSVNDIQSNMSKPDFAYDIVLTGVNLGLFYYDVGSFLHSNQIKNWYNMARIKDSALDTLLSRLTDRLYYDAPDRLRDIQINIQKILEREFVIYTFGSPYEFMGTKNTLRGIKIPEFLAGREMLIDIMSRWYFKEGYKLSSEPKSVIWFFAWLKNELFSST